MLVGGCGAEDSPALRRPGVSREDIAALNAALAFEHLEAGFYAQAVQRPGSARRSGSCWSGSRRTSRRTWRRSRATSATRAGARSPPGRARRRCRDPLETALALEELRAAAYLDQLGGIANAGLLAVALSIHAVEARQVVALRGLTGRVPGQPEALGEPLASARRSSARGSC